MNTQIIAIANQKGCYVPVAHVRHRPERERRSVGKTTTCANLGIGLAQAGKKVLLIDGDPQGSLTISLGNPQPDKLPFTLSDAMGKILMDQPIRPGEGILHHAESVDLMPADIQLSGMEVSLVNAMSRETILRQYLDTLKGQYSHILIDCQPSLGMLTVNALAAANRIIIPVQAEYLPAKGLEQLLSTVSKVKRQINPKLQIDGILLTMVDNRTNFAKEIAALLRDTYGSKIKVFGTEIPHSVRAKEISAEGKSIFAHDPGGKVAEGYRNLTKEVLKMQEEVENRTLTLVVSGTKFTGRMFKAAISKYMAHRKEKKLQKQRSRDAPVIPHGKQTVKQLVGQNQGISNIEITDPSIKEFEKIARKYGVDYAVKKDRSSSPPKYLIFFKGRDADALTAAFTEYTNKKVKKAEKTERPSSQADMAGQW